MDFDFPPVVADIATVPSQFAPLYEKTDNGFKISDDPKVKGAVEAIHGYAKAVKAARSDADAIRKTKIDLTPLKEYGEDPATIATSISERIQKLQDEVGKAAKADVEALRKDLTGHHLKEKESLLQKQNRLREQLCSVFVENTARSAIADLKGDAALLMPFVKERVRVTDNPDGSIAVQVVDETGNRRYNSASNDMTIPELVAEMKTSKTFARLFDSEAPRGGGMPPNGGKATPRNDPSTLNPQEKVKKGLQALRR
jgi:hypothetical protein